MDLYVDLEEPAVQLAIDFIADQIWVSITNIYAKDLKILDQRLKQIVELMTREEAILFIKDHNFLLFMTYDTEEDYLELEQLYETYKDSPTTSITYYLTYHMCETFVILPYTILKLQGRDVKICEDRERNHIYLYPLMDILFTCAKLPVKQGSKCTLYEKLEDFWSLYVDVNNPQEWERKELNDIRAIDNAVS